MSPPPRTITVFTRRAPGETEAAVRRLVQLAAESQITVRVPEEEVAKHGLSDLPGAELGADPDGPTDLAVVMGGDGTILTALRRYAGRDVPVFAINFGAIGFLATVERDGLDDAINRALTGEFDVLRLPALAVGTSSGEHLAVNDISFHRRQDLRVAELGYSVLGAELGEVRCDGLVVSTAAGSTGYNLANGGPVMAWGVQGYVVSFIAPHTLTARALVVAPGDGLQVVNRSPEEPVDVTTDGRLVCTLDPHERVEVTFRDGMARLAQVGGASFYNRLRDKFGRLSY
ncbi:MAG TPA: NAD(+)/NADH kinase [Thermoleophilaceae bacterium]|nr:NAD(+)/NADH kinase [Thermoleophilaceae bacterium]